MVHNIQGSSSISSNPLPSDPNYSNAVSDYNTAQSAAVTLWNYYAANVPPKTSPTPAQEAVIDPIVANAAKAVQSCVTSYSAYLKDIGGGTQTQQTWLLDVQGDLRYYLLPTDGYYLPTNLFHYLPDDPALYPEDKTGGIHGTPPQ